MNEFDAVTAEELETVDGGLNPQPLPPMPIDVRIVRAILAYFK